MPLQRQHIVTNFAFLFALCCAFPIAVPSSLNASVIVCGTLPLEPGQTRLRSQHLIIHQVRRPRAWRTGYGTS